MAGLNDHFALTPSSINMKRSVFDRSTEVKTTFNAGKIVPIYVDEILPGDSVAMKVKAITRMSTSIHATMDSAYQDTYFFFVPNRLVMENWEEFCGANPNPWITNMPVHNIPKITLTASDTVTGSLFDYMGIPLGYAGSINSLPLRAYNLIWNEWFRDTNLMSEIAVPTGDTGDLASYYVVRNACKFHDIFTSCLPGPQRHADVSLPLGIGAPVNAAGPNGEDGRVTMTAGYDGANYIMQVGMGTVSSTIKGITTPATMTGNGAAYAGTLYADLSSATAATINQIRLAFQTQKFYERMGIATGGRYISVLKTMFGVTNGDARLQRPEYLGGFRDLIAMNQVTQNSETGSTPLGAVAGQSVTRTANNGWTKSFTEHGYLIGVTVVRPVHTYQYGIEKLWLRDDLLSFYWPSFAFIGEQPILNKNIYAQGDSVVDAQGHKIDDQVFGYQEAYAEYRYKAPRVCGYFRSNATGTLDSWHYADKYNALPTLGSTWIQETETNIDRTLAVSGAVTHQFISRINFDIKHTRVMPVYSVPGMIDHF